MYLQVLQNLLNFSYWDNNKKVLTLTFMSLLQSTFHKQINPFSLVWYPPCQSYALCHFVVVQKWPSLPKWRAMPKWHNLSFCHCAILTRSLKKIQKRTKISLWKLLCHSLLMSLALWYLSNNLKYILKWH